jgi:hypothetical protein
VFYFEEHFRVGFGFAVGSLSLTARKPIGWDLGCDFDFDFDFTDKCPSIAVVWL